MCTCTHFPDNKYPNHPLCYGLWTRGVLLLVNRSGQVSSGSCINTPCVQQTERERKNQITHQKFARDLAWSFEKMRRFLPLCALLLVFLCLASLTDVTEGKSRGRPYIGGSGARPSNSGRSSGGPRSLSGGTWAACAGSSLLSAAAMLL